MAGILRIWYVSAQRLCNFRCNYCVSINNYAKSNTQEWLKEDDQARFEKVVEWIARRPCQVGVRLGTLGEPFASASFLARAAWLTTHPNVEFVELLTNGSLLKTRLERLNETGDINKLSLWITHHHTEISIPRFIDNARFAQEKYGCFVVVNGLLFPDNEAYILKLKAAAEEAKLRFNLDLGYDPQTPHGTLSTVHSMVPILEKGDGVDRVLKLGANRELLRLNLLALNELGSQLCGAGHRYIYIDIWGNVHRCSRYQAVGRKPLGNVLDDDFQLHLRDAPWAPCEAGFGCGNKEDFLNLQCRKHSDESLFPSLGWLQSPDTLKADGLSGLTKITAEPQLGASVRGARIIV